MCLGDCLFRFDMQIQGVRESLWSCLIRFCSFCSPLQGDKTLELVPSTGYVEGQGN